MKILIAVDCYIPMINGVVTSTMNLKQGLEKRGHEVRILTLSHNKSSYKSNEVYALGSASVGVLYPGVRVKVRKGQEIFADIMQWRPDVVHTQSEFSTFRVARQVATCLNIPIVHTYHTLYEDYTHYFSPSRVMGKSVATTMTQLIARKVDTIIAPTNKVRDLLIGYDVQTDVQVVPSGIELGRFMRRNMAEVNFLRDKLGIPQDNTILLFLGRVCKEKNIDELIGYFSKYRGVDITLLIVGDGPHKLELEKQVSKLDLHNQVIFTGMVDPLDTYKYYQLADLFVSASTSETQGLTYIEALATGTPVLCRQDPCIEGLIVNGMNGYTYSTVGQFYLQLEEYLTLLNKNSMRRLARDSVKGMSVEVFVQRVEDIYCEVIGCKEQYLQN